ncbi:MAG: hypothetical protein WCP91_03675 [Candidatus Berkelbacteria bacterium]
MISKREIILVALIVLVIAAGGLYLLGLGMSHGNSQETSKYLRAVKDLHLQIAGAGQLHIVRDIITPVTVLRQVDSKAGFTTIEVQFGTARMMALLENGAKVVPGSKGYMINVWFSQLDETGSTVPFVLTKEP